MSVLQSNAKTPAPVWRRWLAVGFLSLFAAVSTHAQVGNDNFANAILLSGPSGSVSGTTFGATHEGGEPDHVGLGSQHSVWYRWIAPSTALYALRSERELSY